MCYLTRLFLSLFLGAAIGTKSTASESATSRKDSGNATPPDIKRKLVAKVNGVAIYANVWKRPADSPPTSAVARGFVHPAVQQAIRNEVYAQAAKKQAFDQHPVFQNALAKHRKMERQIPVQLLVRLFQERNDSLRTTRIRDSIPQDDVDAYFETNKARFEKDAGRPKSYIERTIKREIAARRYHQAYRGWLDALRTDTTVTVAGKAIPEERWQAELDLRFANNAGAQVAATDVINAKPSPLWQAFIDITGIAVPLTPPQDTTSGDLEAAMKNLGAVAFEVGKSRFTFGDTLQFHELLQMPVETEGVVRPGRRLFDAIALYILAEAARAEGLELDPVYIERRKAMTEPAMPTRVGDMTVDFNKEKKLLVTTFLAHNVDAPAKYPISDTEIEEYRQKHPNRFRRVETDSKTSSQVNDEVRRALLKEKIEIASRTFEQDLLKDARIENFD